MENKDRQIILNQIRTPGGTIIRSMHCHDRVEAGELDTSSEVDSLRARVAELEKGLEDLLRECDYQASCGNMNEHRIEFERARSLLNKK